MTAIFNQGYFGVTFFFILSGFVLTYASKNVKISTFYVRRFARIYPLHILALVFALPVFYSFVTPPDNQWWIKSFDAGVILLSLFLLQGFSRNEQILFSGNPAAWTLSAEMFFYTLHPFLGKLFVPSRIKQSLYILVGSVVTLIVIDLMNSFDLTQPLIQQIPFPILRAPEFLSGMALAWAVRNGRIFNISMIYPLIFLSLVLVFLILLNVYPENMFFSSVNILRESMVTIGCLALIASVASIDLSGRKTHLRNKLLVKLGEWSYAFYLLHGTLIYLLLTWFGKQPPRLLNLVWIVVILLISLVFSALAHEFFEKPIERRLRNWKDRKDSMLADSEERT